MTILFYSKTKNGIGARLHQEIKAVVPKGDIKVFRNMNSLSERLRRQYRYKIDAAILLATSQKELSGFLAIRDLFQNLSIILVLPDWEKETISKGHSLYPRFISYSDSDFKDIAAVLEKMLKHLNSHKTYQKGGANKWQN